ncbi:MAG: hypothetical protein H8E66_13835 [Planctomycetes bacterium]|nr:hypothetical protein [Planctomycetota bacterium]
METYSVHSRIGLQIRLSPAGDILGSCYIEFNGEGQRFVISGDLGAPHAPLLKDPVAPERADLLVLATEIEKLGIATR